MSTQETRGRTTSRAWPVAAVGLLLLVFVPVGAQPGGDDPLLRRWLGPHDWRRDREAHGDLLSGPRHLVRRPLEPRGAEPLLRA